MASVILACPSRRAIRRSSGCLLRRMIEAMAQTYEGGCHCGRVRFRVTADLSRVTECNCSICAKKGFLHLIVSPEAFALLRGKDALSTYPSNTGTARLSFRAAFRIHPV